MLSHTLSCFHLLTVLGARQGEMMIGILQLSPREVGWLRWLIWPHSRGRIRKPGAQGSDAGLGAFLETLE